MTKEEQICHSCQTADFHQFGGHFTPLQLQDELMGLICIQCGTCKAASKSASKTNFQSLEKILQSKENFQQEWVLAQTEEDKLKHKILNFAVYRINEPPNEDLYESNYSAPIGQVSH